MNEIREKKMIFLSYTSEDRELATIVHNAIEEAFPGAFQIFNAFERNSIAPSEEWRIKLRSAVVKSSILLVLVTRNALTKQWIFWECGGAYHREIPIIPLIGPGCDITNLPEPLREIQAVQIQRESGLRRMMDRLAQLSGMSHLSEKYSLSPFLEQINNVQTHFIGKQWSEMTKNALQRFFVNPGGDPILEIRAVSYTSETMAKTIPHYVDQNYLGNVVLRIRMLVRSEYGQFASRPKDFKFNQIIRWRISRAKADWYSWIRNTRLRKNSNTMIELEIRDYWMDPSARMLLLGKSEGFFGLYALKFQPPNEHQRTEIPPALDWVANETTMAPITNSNPQLINDIVDWFDHIWHQSKFRTNEGYRCEVSDSLLELTEKKATSEAFATTFIRRWKETRRDVANKWKIGNLSLPSCYPEQTSDIIDFMACAVVFKETNDIVLVCEIRQPGETWEGIGKTSTYLDLIGIMPEIYLNNKKLQCDSLQSLYEAVCNGAIAKWNVEHLNKNTSLFATDFVWLYQDHGIIQIIKPEGEILWGIWDSARYLLRKSLSSSAWFEGVQRSNLGRLVQQELFVKLPFNELASCYCQDNEISVSAIIIFCPDTNQEFHVDKIENSYAAQRLLIEAIKSAPHHPSQFWRRTDFEVNQHNDLAARIVNGLRADFLPQVYTIQHRLPFESVADLIRKQVYPKLHEKK